MKLNSPRISNKIRNVLELFSCFMLCVCTMSAFYGAIVRYVFNNPVKWVEELSALSLVWMVLSYQFKLEVENDQLSMSVLFDRMPAKLRKVLSYVQHVIVILIFGYLLLPSFHIVQRNYLMATTTQGLGLPIWLAYLIMPFYFITSILVKISKLIFGNQQNQIQ